MIIFFNEDSLYKNKAIFEVVDSLKSKDLGKGLMLLFNAAVDYKMKMDVLPEVIAMEQLLKDNTVKAPDTDVPKILLASFATAKAGGIPKNIKTGVIKNPPPIPNRPDMTPIIKLSINIVIMLI